MLDHVPVALVIQQSLPAYSDRYAHLRHRDPSRHVRLPPSMTVGAVVADMSRSCDLIAEHVLRPEDSSQGLRHQIWRAVLPRSHVRL